MATLMSMVSGAAASSTDEAPKETEGSDKEASSEQETTEQESDEDAQDHVRLLGHFGHTQVAGGAKPKPPASPAPKSTPQKGQPSQKHTAFGQAGSAIKKKKSTDSDANSTVLHQRSVRAPGAGVEQSTFVLDGRGQRLLQASADGLDK
eukprot:9058985-Lingulodinium_polyedra.AAC.1